MCIFLVSDIEGSISEFREGNSFYSLVNINNDTNATDFLYCEIPKPSKIKNNYEISCYPYYEMENNTENYNFDLTPYYMPYYYQSPFEIFIQNNIKPMKYEDYQKLKEKEKENEKTIFESLLSLVMNPVFIILSVSSLILLSLIKLFLL